MAVRNFYVEASIDGRRTTLAGGPASRTGGMVVHIHQRNDGSAELDAVRIKCYENNGNLITEVYNSEGRKVFEYGTKR